jgi:hypothetical protein
MHLERVQPHPRLDAHLTSATDHTLELALRSEDGRRSSDLQDAVRAVCIEARRQGMRAEEVIILLKKMWYARPELPTMSLEETGRLLDSLVSMCVEEYYDGGC